MRLQNCNSIPEDGIIKLIETGDFTLDEFIAAGLGDEIIGSIRKKQIITTTTIAEDAKKEELQKQKIALLDRILEGEIFASEIKGLIDKGSISFDNLLDHGVASKTVNALKYFCNEQRITRSYKIKDLPPMEEGRTDVYFVGLPGSGKSTMIAGLLNIANITGTLLPDPYHPAGVTYQTDLIQDLKRNVLPEPTAQGSYNYIAASLKDSNDKSHPLNIVDVPGELYEKIQDNAEVAEFLEYINNKNKKVLIFVVDSLAHENNESTSRYDQSVVFPNILQIFNKNGVLEQTDAIYLVVNKFDAIKESDNSLNRRSNGDIALEFINREFLSLKNNCIDARKNTRNSFNIKVMPFSIGNLSYRYILNSFDRDFAQTLLNQITKDSFVVRGGTNKIFN